MTHTIQLDIVFEESINELYQHFAQTHIKFEVIQEEGPGGGWPHAKLCQLTADESVLETWLLENYCDSDQIDFFMGREE
jgi:hypothetical protein